MNSYVVLMLAAVGAACSGATEATREPSSQGVHVPSGVAELAVPAVAPSGVRVGLSAVPDLRIDTGVTGREYAARVSIDVGRDGRIYALDLLESNVVAYEPTGERNADWQPDPKDLLGALALATSGGRVAVIKFDPNALSIFESTGTLAAVHPFQQHFWKLHGLADGTFLTFDVGAYSFSRLGNDGTELRRFTVLSNGAPERPQDLELDPELLPEPSFAVADNRIYVTGSATYEVATFSVDGDPRFVLRAPWEREPIPDSALPETGRTLRAGRAMRANVEADESAALPTHYPALSRIAADGRGRLYVFPHVHDARPSNGFPVDVYSPEGRLLANGRLSFQGWAAALGNHIYRVERIGDMLQIVRYRLTLPATTALAAGQ